jgi:class 3 adenylate cyclase
MCSGRCEVARLVFLESAGPGRHHEEPVRQRHAKSLQTPDEVEQYELVSQALVELGDLTVARLVFRPGWRWSSFMPQVVGGDWCQARHVGVVLGGRFGFTFEDGTTVEIKTDDVFDIPAGHDGYTVGDEDCILLEWLGVRATSGFPLGVGNRVLATLLFTDLVGSTERVTRIGDVAWHDLLSRHYESVRRELERFRGREIETTGDGVLARFEGPAAALQCAAAIVRDAMDLDLEVRAGVHVGEVQLVGAGVRGVAVHEAARVMATAGPNEILVSETVRVLAEAAGLMFEDRGLHSLKGLDGKRRLFAYAAARPDD